MIWYIYIYIVFLSCPYCNIYNIIITKAKIRNVNNVMMLQLFKNVLEYK